MGFIHRRTSKQASKVKNLLGLTLSRLAVARRPRLARRSISRDDVGQLLALGHQDRALHRVWDSLGSQSSYILFNGSILMLALFSLQAEQVIQEEKMLEAFDMIEVYCNRLIEHAAQLDKLQYVSF